MIELVSLWERGWLDAKVEAFMWKQLSNAFGVDRLIFCPSKLGRSKPSEYDSIPAALASSNCKPVFLVPDHGVRLASYEHPEDAIYVFGNAQDDNLRWSGDHDVVRIHTPNRVDFFAVDAAAIVLYDRMIKRGDHGD